MTAVLFERAGEEAFEAVLGKVVAEGGSGVVQEARRADGTGAPFIVKRARAGGEKLLEYERTSCELVDHASLVRYLGVANIEGLGPLVAFEALASNPLLALNGTSTRPQWRDPGTAYYPLPPNRAIELAFDLLLGIEHLHERGLVHADVKLANLLVRVAGERDAGSALRQVAEGRFTGVLIDLGSVRRTAVLEALTKGHADLSLIPSVTPLYAPPEVLFESASTGGRKVFSPAMDIYSFALVFYALLTGRIPYAHFVSAERLKEVGLVLDLKGKEISRAVAPVDLFTLSRVPLHDVGFEGTSLTVWPLFHAAAKEIFVRCLDPDPAKRIDAKGARALFTEGFRMRNVGEAGPRPWVQGIFQMRPRSNRLVRDVPLGGIRIREESGELIVDETAPPDSQPGQHTQVIREEALASAAEGASRPSARLPKAPPAPKGMIYLADVLREHKAKRPLPVTAPVLVTRTGFSPADLVKCTLYSLEQAREHVRVSDNVADAVSSKHRVSAGRGEDNDIVVADSSVSKRHLYFEKGPDGGWWVIDNDSSNGTFIEEEELQKKGKVRLSRGLVTIGLGLTAKLTFMQQAELDQYLEKALDLWTQAFAGKASGRHKRLDEGGTVVAARDRGATEVVDPTPLAPPRLPPLPAATPPANPRAVTKKQIRNDALNAMVNKAPVPHTPSAAPRPLATTPEELAKKLAELTDVASFAVHFEDARADDFEAASEVLDVLASGDAVLGVDVVFRTGKKVVLYRKNPAAP